MKPVKEVKEIWSALNKLFNKETTFKKLINILLVKFSCNLRLSRVIGKPFFLTVEPTNRCNLNCPLCTARKSRKNIKRSEMSFNDFKMIIDELGDSLYQLLLFNYGEPFLNQDIFRFITYAKKKKIQVVINTNGTLLENKTTREKLLYSKLDKLIISIDGATEHTYLKYRGGSNFKTLLMGIDNLIRERNKENRSMPEVELQFIVMRHNEHEIYKIKKLAKKLKVDEISYKLCYLGNVPHINDANNYLPLNKQYSGYTIINNEIFVKKKHKCPLLGYSSVIRSDGAVVPCCYDSSNSYVLGNVFQEKSFSKIWNNKEYVNFRKKWFRNQNKIIMCKTCFVDINQFPKRTKFKK